MAIDYNLFVHNLCHHLGMHPRDVLGDNRFHSIHEVRLVVWQTLADQGLLPKEIAPLVQRDRTTVLHGLRIAKMRLNEPDFAAKVREAKKLPLKPREQIH